MGKYIEKSQLVNMLNSDSETDIAFAVKIIQKMRYTRSMKFKDILTSELNKSKWRKNTTYTYASVDSTILRFYFIREIDYDKNMYYIINDR